MAMAIVTLTTDFGTRDGYAGAVKGVLLSLEPGIDIVDLSHEIPPGDVAAGAWCLRVAAPEFPAGAVHLAVVDPGVGSSRHAVILEAGAHLYLGPDNGLLSLVPDPLRAFAIDASRVVRDGRLAPTFHGRDLFAPAAARLASGEDPASLGTQIEPGDLVALPVDAGWSEQGGEAVGCVVHVDRFGNLVTSLPAALLARACAAGGSAGGRPVLGPVASYEGIAQGGAAFIEGSQGLVEISVRGASASSLLGLGVGSEVRLSLSQGEEA
jgi:S-adenosylmethionine hydrolase